MEQAPVSAGHVPRSKFSARGGVGKVSNYMLQKHKFCELLSSKYLLIFVYFICFEFARTFLHFYQQSSQETKQIVTYVVINALFTLERGFIRQTFMGFQWSSFKIRH